VKFEAQIDDAVIPVDVRETAPGRHEVQVGEATFSVDARRAAEGIWSLLIGPDAHTVDVNEEDGVFVVQVDGETYRIRVEEETRYIIRTRGGHAAQAGQSLKAPMPGRVVLVEVTVGQAVRPGDGLIVLEAMKMENEFRATVAGVVKEVRVQVGQAVNPGDVLVVIE